MQKQNRFVRYLIWVVLAIAMVCLALYLMHLQDAHDDAMRVKLADVTQDREMLLACLNGHAVLVVDGDRATCHVASLRRTRHAR